ncbi:ATP-binding cassette domain-containing protein [candidate division WOR-3 bacterium]|nr:ATP-binding cassette domain-containing protein [candidate division WOR-3 bacterium]
MISLSNITMEFGTQELYHDVNLFVGPEDRIGLAGPNGSGKSTILKLMSGELEPTRGSVDRRRGTCVAYLPQTGAVVGERTVLEEAMTAFKHLDDVQAEMIELEHRMKDANMPPAELQEVLDRYSVLQHHFGHDAYDRRPRAEKVLMSLGFAEEDFHKQTRTQSGGFQVRLALARMLLEEPDVLLLDEPTNYLDIRSIEWLQEYLSTFKGAVVMIAHDRYLLDAVVQKVWAIESHKMFIFPGDYSKYLDDKVRRDERQLKKFEEQQQFIKRTEQFIAQYKGRKDTAPRAMSRQKMLDKLELVEPPETMPAIRIRFPEASEVYGKAVDLRSVAKRFGPKQVLEDVDLVVGGGEKIGLFGANGQGKTTLLRIIAGKLAPDSGEAWASQKTQIAYYEQGAEEMLDPEMTVLEAAADAGAGFTENELKGILGTFLFSGDALDKKVAVLSGGERSRLAIIRALLTPSNLLILDEPTNHLDIQSREILFEAIRRYRRTVVFAAHDRFMLDELADKTVRIEAGRAMLFPGNYSYAAGRVVKHGAGSPKSQGQRTKQEGQRTKNDVRSRKLEARSQKSRARGKGSVVHQSADPVADIEQRLREIEAEHESARQAMDFNRVRELAEERKYLEAELEARKADQVEGSGASAGNT